MPQKRFAPTAVGYTFLAWIALLTLPIPAGAQGETATQPSRDTPSPSFVRIFDGKTFAGWEGDIEKTWRIADGVIAGGSLEATVPRNEFLATRREYGDFELRLRYKLVGTEGFVNGGVQFRSRRVPNHHEMIGYQADLGAGYDGHLYDESRRRRMLTDAAAEIISRITRHGDWNEYTIRAEGARVQLWLNGVRTVDYTEPDENIARRGVLALQIHGNCKAIVRFKDIEIRDLGASDAATPTERKDDVPPDVSRLREGLIGSWGFDGDVLSRRPVKLDGELRGGARFVDSPFGQALSVDGIDDYVVVPRASEMDVGDGEFSVAAWVRPRELRQAGFVCLGRYSWVHGWYFDMPHPNGVLRIETVSPQNRPNGTVQTAPGMIVAGEWTHVAATVRRGTNRTTLYVNGSPVARGTVGGAQLDNPTTQLHIGRIENAQLFSGEIDEVYLYRRALAPAEVQGLVEPGRAIVQDRQASLAPAVKRFGEARRETARSERFRDKRFALDSAETVVFAGGADVARWRYDGTLEALLVAEFADAAPRFRNMAWEGDTVHEQWRDLNFGTWHDQLASIRARVIIAAFGQMESLAGSEGLEAYVADYGRLLDEYALQTERIVLISPRPFERPPQPHFPDHTSKNIAVRAYVEATRQLARDRGFLFVDLFTPVTNGTLQGSLTSNGVHLKPSARRPVAIEIVRQLGIESRVATDHPAFRELTAAVVEKGRLWFDNWRPMNWAFAFGDRTNQPFGKPSGERPALRVELESFKPLIAAADQRVARLAHSIRDDEALVQSKQRDVAPAAPRRPETDGKPAREDHSPEAELASFELAEGFAVNLFASEADGVVKPLQMAWDDANRLWVLCAPTYPHIEPGSKPDDYVLVCEDRDQDGRADSFVRFAEGLFMPMGIEFGNGGVYLAEATELVHLVDTDGDGRADSREVILSGFGTADAHQMISSLAWGPNGALWFAQGHHIYSHVETAHGISKLHKSGIWRYRPRTGRLHGFFNLSSAGLNCQGIDFDDYGQVFHNSAALSGGFYTVAGMVPTLQPLRYWPLTEPPRRNTGIEFIGTSHLPEALQGTAVWGGFMTNDVQVRELVDEGAGFVARRLPDILRSNRSEFRPVNVRVGPDGAIYVCDWYNAIIGHYQASYRDPRRDKSRGRIWRIRAKARALAKPVRVAEKTIPELIAALDSTERLVRRSAKRRLFDADTSAVVTAVVAAIDALEESEATIAQREQRLLELVGVLEAHEVVRPDRLRQLLTATDPRVRAYGARVVGNWLERLQAPLELLEPCVSDPHPRVRLEAIVAASYSRSPQAMELAATVVDMPMDRFLDYALKQTVAALKPYWYPALRRGELHFGGKPERLRFVLEADGTRDVAKFIRELASETSLESPARDGLLSLLVDVGGEDDLRFAWDVAPESLMVLEALAAVSRRHRRRPSGELGEKLQRLISSHDAARRATGIRLAGLWGVEELGDTIAGLLSHESSSDAVVVAAMEAHAALAGVSAASDIERVLRSKRSLATRVAGLASLASLELERAAVAAVALLPVIRSEEAMAKALAPFLERQGGTEALAVALSGGDPAEEVGREGDASAVSVLSVDGARWMHRVLSGAGRSDRALLERLEDRLGISGEPRPYDEELVRRTAERALQIGDAERGRKVFTSTLANCAACHRVGGEGGDRGPDLSTIGAGRSAELLTESVLFPNRQIREGYMSRTVLTKDGHVYTGYEVKRTDDELYLRDAATDETRRIARASIIRVEDAGSAMPAGLTAPLTEAETSDLIRYLIGLGRDPAAGRRSTQ